MHISNEMEMTDPNSSHETSGPASGFLIAAAAAREDTWYLLKSNVDLSGGDASSDECSSLKRCQALMQQKPHETDDGQRLAYQYRDGKLLQKPVDLGAEWRSGSTNLIMWGRSVNHKANGKMLIALHGVDMQGGNGKVERNVSSYEEALDIAKRWEDTDTATFWHAPSNQLINKPKNNGARWGRGDGTLFMWADKPLFDSSSSTNIGRGGILGNVLSGHSGHRGRGGSVSNRRSNDDIELTEVYGEQSTDLFDDFQEVHEERPGGHAPRSFWGAARSTGSSSERRPKELAIVMGTDDNGSDEDAIELEYLYDIAEDLDWSNTHDLHDYTHTRSSPFGCPRYCCSSQHTSQLLAFHWLSLFSSPSLGY
jgi:hypothetical protein